MSHMTNDPRSALNRLIAAFEAHLDAAATGDELSPAVVAAENALQDAFFTYDDSLFTAYGIELPLRPSTPTAMTMTTRTTTMASMTKMMKKTTTTRTTTTRTD